MCVYVGEEGTSIEVYEGGDDIWCRWTVVHKRK